MIIACYEKGWFSHKTDYRMWSNLCRSMNEPFQLVESLENIEIDDGYEVVAIDESGDDLLQDFIHPDKAVYLFGRSCLNRIQDIVKSDHVVKVATPSSKDIFGISIAAIVLYDRMMKA